VLAGVLLVLGGLLGALPWLASGATGRDYLLQRVNAALKGTLHATDLELGWSGGQLLGGVELHDPDGRRVLRFEELRTDAGLLSLLAGDYDLGRVVLTGLELDVVRDEDGRLNLAAAIEKKETEKEEQEPLEEVLRDLENALPASLRVALEVPDAQIRYRDPALEQPVEWTGALDLKLAGPDHPAVLRCRGETEPVGRVDLQATLEGFEKLSVRLQGELAAQLEPTLGKNLSVGLELATAADGVTFGIEVIAERLQVSGGGRATLFDERPRVTLARPFEALWRADSRLLATGDDVQLPEEILVKLKVDSLDTPLDGKDARGHALLGVLPGAGRVRWAGSLREVAWRDWRAELTLAERVAFRLGGKLASQGQEGSLSLAGTAQDVTDWKRARVDAVATLDDFPLEPIEELLGRKTRLVDLLGERMDLDVRTASAGEGKHTVRLRAESAHLTVEGPVEVDAAAERVAAQGLTADWRLSPRSAERLFGGTLAEAVPVRLQIESLATRLTRFDPEATALTASLEIGDGSLQYEQEEVAWSGLQASVAAPDVREGVQLRATGEIAQGDERTTIDIRGNLANLWNESGAFEPGQFRGELTAKLQGLPARAVGLPDDALGGRCDADIELKGGSETSQGHLILRAPNLDAQVPLRLGEEVAVENATVRYRPPPKYATGNLVVTVPRLVIPVPWRLSDLRGEARLAAERLAVSGVTFSGLEGRFDAETFLLTGRVTGVEDPLLRKGLAPPLLLRLEGESNLERLPTIERLRMQLEGALVKLHGTARLEDGTRLVVTEPAVADYELRPGVLERLELAAPVRLHVEVPQMEVPLAKLRVRAILGRAEITAPRVALREATLADIKLSVVNGEEVTIEGGGRITRPGQPRPFAVAARYRDRESWDARVANLSLHLVEALAGGEGLVEAFGEEATFEIAREPKAAWCRVHAPNLEFDAEGPLTDAIELSKPATLRWTMTPAAWQGGDFGLRAPAVVGARIERFRLPFDESFQPAWERLALQVDLRIPTLELQDLRGNRPLAVRQVQVKASTAGDTLRAVVSGRLNGGRAHGEVELEEAARLAGHSARRGSWAAVLGLPEPRGELRKAVTGRGRLDFIRFPVWLLDRLFVLDEYAQTVLGPTADATATWRVDRGDGPLRVRVDAPRAKASAQARLTPDGVRLDKEMTADLTLTQELGALVLPKLGPFFRGLESAEHPVRVRIPPKGFLLPLEQFDISKVTVSTATIDIGRAVFNNAWLTNALQLVTRSRAPGGLTSAWFTPLDLEIKDGVIRYRKRVDLLTQDKMHLASWGWVDLGKDRVDVTFAFMPDALRHHLGVSRARDGDALRIPVRGTIAKPELKLGNTLAGLAKIQLRDKAIAEINEPFARAIAEAVLEKAFSKSLRGGFVPPPTVDPLPWKKLEEEEMKKKEK
jgi:hypothetical protein